MHLLLCLTTVIYCRRRLCSWNLTAGGYGGLDTKCMSCRRREVGRGLNGPWTFATRAISQSAIWRPWHRTRAEALLCLGREAAVGRWNFTQGALPTWLAGSLAAWRSGQSWGCSYGGCSNRCRAVVSRLSPTPSRNPHIPAFRRTMRRPIFSRRNVEIL